MLINWKKMELVESALMSLNYITYYDKIVLGGVCVLECTDNN